MHFVYLLKSINFPDQKYIGYTTNINARITVHNFGGSFHTAKYKPWAVHAYFAFANKYQAFEFEKYLKSHAGIAFANKRLW